MNAAEVWYVFVDHTVAPAEVARAEALLSSEEQERGRRFHFHADRLQFVTGHALVRTMLSHFASVRPGEWEFRSNRYDRPEVSAPAEYARLRFNLSHTRGLVACIVADGFDVGVDVECSDATVCEIDIARRFFSPIEVRALDSLQPEQRSKAFLDYWTLKEAYIKARGTGLSLPLDRFSFELFPGRAPQITLEPCMEDDASCWRFERFRPSDRHCMAVALRCEGRPDVPISFREITVRSMLRSVETQLR